MRPQGVAAALAAGAAVIVITALGVARIRAEGARRDQTWRSAVCESTRAALDRCERQPWRSVLARYEGCEPMRAYLRDRCPEPARP